MTKPAVQIVNVVASGSLKHGIDTKAVNEIFPETKYAKADGLNSPSWNIFIHEGPSPRGLRGQLRDLGLNLIRLHRIGLPNSTLSAEEHHFQRRQAKRTWPSLGSQLSTLCRDSPRTTG